MRVSEVRLAPNHALHVTSYIHSYDVTILCHVVRTTPLCPSLKHMVFVCLVRTQAPPSFSRMHAEKRASLKNWEVPGYEASVCVEHLCSHTVPVVCTLGKLLWVGLSASSSCLNSISDSRIVACT